MKELVEINETSKKKVKSNYLFLTCVSAYYVRNQTLKLHFSWDLKTKKYLDK